MRVTTVSAAIRFSKDTGQGWKTIDIGAEASLDPDDDWVVAQQGLYSQLTAQLRQLWQQEWCQSRACPEWLSEARTD
jgi:hypothetical protein